MAKSLITDLIGDDHISIDIRNIVLVKKVLVVQKSLEKVARHRVSE
jgi:hypothetical protein